MMFPPPLTFTSLMLLMCSFTGKIDAANLDVRRFGATGNGVTSETIAIQNAVDECTRQGGGTVTFPAGRYVTGTILLKDNVRLHLDEGSTILGSTDIADYRAVELFTEGTGQRMGWCLIGALAARNIGIEGPGAIDGRGGELNAARPPSEREKRPVGLRFVRCDGVCLDHLRLQASAMWMVHCANSANIRADKVVIHNQVSANNDGFDIDSCDGVQITDCDVDSLDDAICLKSTYPNPSRNIVVSHCRLRSRCSTIKMGTESLGGFDHVNINDIEILGAGFGGINVFSVDGGAVADITIADVRMETVNVAIVLRLGARLRTFHEGDAKKSAGTIRGITIRNVNAKRSELTGIIISGIPDHRIEDVTLENIDITVPGGGKPEAVGVVPPERESAYPESVMFGHPLPGYGMFIRHVQGLRLRNYRVTPLEADARPANFLQDVEGFHDERATPAP